MVYRILRAIFLLQLALSSLPALAQVEVRGRQVLVEGKPFVIKAVCWNPVARGATHPNGLIFLNPNASRLKTIEEDFRLMKEAGINTIRTYEAITDKRVLDLVSKYELYMIVPVFNYYRTTAAKTLNILNVLKDHPRVLLWEIGNEWNYNGFYSNPRLDSKALLQMVKSTLALVRSVDRSKPVSTVYGELPPAAVLKELADIDVWGLNVYSGLSFYNRFNDWKKLSSKPMYFAEFGADAYNALIGAPDEAAQAKATASLLNEIMKNLSASDSVKAALGGALFEWSDELWKDTTGSPASQDTGGVAPGGGPYPDRVFNEEWWGVVDIDRKPRLAYEEIKAIWTKDLSFF